MNDRTNKYRVWDGEQMHGPFSVQTMLRAIHDPGGFSSLLDVPQGGEWLQYTGLTDAEDREIYEGDIVEGSAMGCIGPLEKVEMKQGGWFPFMIHGWEDQVEPSECHVIGNTFQNPSLLDKPLPNNDMDNETHESEAARN